ncbi:hypothetical protein DEEACLCL_00016 [Salmonella phage CRW-SP2]|nr:hypothetical protein DEEACLCL_00016 [Salmonella phage CRW-SP2]
MKISSFVANSHLYNDRLRETLNTIRDIRIQLIGSRPSDKKDADQPEPSCLLSDIDLAIEVRDFLHSEIESEMTLISDAMGERFHPNCESEKCSSM